MMLPERPEAPLPPVRSTGYNYGTLQIMCCGIWIDYPDIDAPASCSICHTTFVLAER